MALWFSVRFLLLDFISVFVWIVIFKYQYGIDVVLPEFIGGASTCM